MLRLWVSSSPHLVGLSEPLLCFSAAFRRMFVESLDHAFFVTFCNWPL
jgi:hypothetical protein